MIIVIVIVVLFVLLLAGGGLYLYMNPLGQGCTDDAFEEYDPDATKDDGSCVTRKPVPGCTDILYTEYSSSATKDDGSCVTLKPVPGCTDSMYAEYSSSATKNDGSCVTRKPVPGCTDSMYAEYSSSATKDDSSCKTLDCTRFTATITSTDTTCNINNLTNGYYGGASATVNPIGGTGHTYEWSDGQTGRTAINLIPGTYTCTITSESGCQVTKSATINNPAECPTIGCTYQEFEEFNPLASQLEASSQKTINDARCLTVVKGCTDNTMQNYNPRAGEDDGTCIEIIKSCKNPFATNYEPTGGVDNSLCEWPTRKMTWGGGKCDGEFEVEVYPANPMIFNDTRYEKSLTIDDNDANFPLKAQDFIDNTGATPSFYLHSQPTNCNTPNQAFESGFGISAPPNKKRLIMLNSTAEPSPPVYPDNATGYVMRRVGGGAPGGCVDPDPPLQDKVDSYGDGCPQYNVRADWCGDDADRWATKRDDGSPLFNANDDCCACKVTNPVPPNGEPQYTRYGNRAPPMARVLASVSPTGITQRIGCSHVSPVM